ncbi:uncharacterized protein LOC116179702 [Photinus pyralis]|uniref:uncharacterized protein LOC116179702 n=1 Tax=Photinus pyralis TaxID=7054 RepID=UPI0012670D99|nr:uncharacterized protein LOC116179702 [Photinus pyralis]
MEHIKRFPVIESHYCRRTTKRKYLEPNLSVAKMYNLYVKDCEEKNTIPVKLSYYRHIFTHNFNYGFHVPKKDRCLKCESYKIKKEDKTLSQEEEDEYNTHNELKARMRLERNTDRDSKIPTLSFDLENVITCPRSEVGDFFYSQKLNIYNLTGHFSTTGQAYCAIWSESRQGRGGNIIASAFRRILDQVLTDNNVSELITWSDSCVPQNRNSFISLAVMNAIREHPELGGITMKYSIPGHGAIQEVDNIYSNIERFMAKTEFYSPLSFMRNLKSVNNRKPYKILQMRDEDFKDFEKNAKRLSFNKIPFSKVAALQFTQNLFEVGYKLKHGDDFVMQTLKNDRALGIPSRRNKETTSVLDLKPKTLIPKNSLPEEKIKAIKKMIDSCMPDIDKKYFSALLNTLK